MSNIVAQIEKRGADADQALLASDFERALTLATSMFGLLARVPDGEKLGDAGARLTWDRNAVNEFIKAIADRRRDTHVSDTSNVAGIAISQVQFTRGDC